MRGGCKRFVAIESKSFDLNIVGTAEDILKISENGRGRRTSLLLPENVALWLLRAWGRFFKSKSPNWCNQVRRGSTIFLLESKKNRAGKFLQLSMVNKGKRSFVIFPAGWNERGWAKIFNALSEIVNLAFLDTSRALRRPTHQMTLVHDAVPPPATLPPPPPPGCCPKCGFTGEPQRFLLPVPHFVAKMHTRNVKEAVQELSSSKHMEMDRGKERVVTELEMRASSSVNTQVYSRRISLGNGRNRVHESKGSTSEGSTYWSPDVLLVHDAGSPSADEAKRVDPALYEAKICGQAASNSFVPVARDAAVSHQAHRDSLVLDTHPRSDSLKLSNEMVPSSSSSLPWLFEEKDQSRSCVVNAPFSLFSMGNQTSLSKHNWGLDLCGGVPCELPREVVRDAIAMTVSSRNNAPASRFWDTTDEFAGHEWPLVPMDSCTGVDDLVAPLAVDYSSFHGPNRSYSVEDVWDGENVNSDNVSKWVASKLKSIAACIGVAFSGYEHEVIHLLSRIENSSVIPKPTVQRTPPSTRRQRELKRLEFGVNYERPCTSTSGLMVPYV